MSGDKLHDANVVRALLEGARQHALGTEHFNQAIHSVSQLEREIIKLSRQNAEIGRRPVRGTGVHTKMRQHLVDNLFALLEYPQDLLPTLERRLSGPVENVFEVVDSVLEEYQRLLAIKPSLYPEQVSKPVLVEDVIIERAGAIVTGSITVIQIPLEGLES